MVPMRGHIIKIEPTNDSKNKITFEIQSKEDSARYMRLQEHTKYSDLVLNNDDFSATENSHIFEIVIL